MDNKSIEFLKNLKKNFADVVKDNKLDMEAVKVIAVGLTPREAIGNPKRQDFPILVGKEVMLQGEYQGSLGQAFTSKPVNFNGTLAEILDLDIIYDEAARGVFLAAMNGVMKSLNLIEHTVHCKDEEPELCAKEIAEILKKDYSFAKIALIGYQPSIFEALAEEFTLRVLDLNPANVGENRFGIKVEHGIDDYEEVVLKWADLVLCTGSVFCNNTFLKYVNIGKKVIFFGTTAAGLAHFCNFARVCPKSC